MADKQKTNVIPNTTQTPNVIYDEWMPILSDVELRVVLVIARQTFGWIADKETGRRKEKDWISHTQLENKTARGKSSLSKALKRLIDGLHFVEAFSDEGEVLDTPEKRMKWGQKINYRLKTEFLQLPLFKTHPKFRRVKKPRGKSIKNPRHRKSFSQPLQNLDAQNLDATKETPITKLAKASKLDPEIKKSSKNGVFGNGKQHKRHSEKKLPTNTLMRTFNEYSQTIRKQKPIFTRFKDGNLIKCALKYLTETQIEQLFIWFLAEKKEMQSTIGAALCKEVVGDFIQKSSSEYGFYRQIDSLYQRFFRKQNESNEQENKAMVDALKKLYSSFGIDISSSERAKIAEEVSSEERSLRA